MRDTALEYLYGQDTFAAITYLSQQPDTLAVAQTFAELVRHLYWQKKDVHHVIVMAQAGIQFGLTEADSQEAHDVNLAAQLRGIAKGLAYDLGSFTWPGWNEPGILLQEAHVRFGYEGAKVNLRLAHALNKGDLPLSRAYWLLGAHCLATGEHEATQKHFWEAIRYAQATDETGSVLLYEGYQCLAAFLATSDAARQSDFLAILTRLESISEGASLAEQLKTAWKVFADATTAEYWKA